MESSSPKTVKGCPFIQIMKPDPKDPSKPVFSEAQKILTLSITQSNRRILHSQIYIFSQSDASNYSLINVVLMPEVSCSFPQMKYCFQASKSVIHILCTAMIRYKKFESCFSSTTNFPDSTSFN
jgi:hypothetical protein